MSRVVVVGSGAGGATVARELAGRHDVTVLEAGRGFKPLRYSIDTLSPARGAFSFLGVRTVPLVFPSMRARRIDDGTSSGDRIVLVNAIGPGGTTTIAAGNAVRADESLRCRGIDLDEEFDQLAREVPVTTAHERRWGPSLRRLEQVCGSLGLEPSPSVKFGDYSRCTRCGRCILGCPAGAKWDARRLLEDAASRGARVETGWVVHSLVSRGSRAAGVRARRGPRFVTFPADLVFICAGALGTPAILERSAVACERRLFVDPVLCLAAPLPGVGLDREISMPFIVRRDGYILAPYMDWLSFFFDSRWRMPRGDIISLMIKIADDDRGKVGKDGIEKELTGGDWSRLASGVELAGEILSRMGASRESHFLGILNAGHPGGSLPVGSGPGAFHDPRLPENVWVADASLMPEALGLPPMLTIMAMAKRVARLASAAGGS